MFSVIKRHRKEREYCGQKERIGEGLGEARRTGGTAKGAGFRQQQKNCRNVGYKSIENQAWGVGGLTDLTKILKN